MCELKVYHCNEWHNEYTEFYMKSEADKVLADLEESHKKEVEQLLIEIVELKEQVHEYALGSYVLQARAEKEARHHKYKRCLAMAELCNAKWYDIATKYYKSVLYRKWELKWLKLAEKFKEAK